MNSDIRVPKQKRSIEKKEKIVKAGWELITKNGYYNTNTAEIASYAGVSTGIVYQYFKDKHDILIEGIHQYGDDIFYPMIKLHNSDFHYDDFSSFIKDMIQDYIKGHKVSQRAHEEIMAMVHIDKEVADYFYQREMELTDAMYELLKEQYSDTYLKEKVHVMIGMIDNLCHEVVYHQHKGLNYEKMIDIVISNINQLVLK